MENIFADKTEQLSLFGGTIEEEKKSSLFDKFLIPPFSVFDGRQGYWQDRKRLWTSLGIKSEVGRDDNLCFNINSFNAEDDILARHGMKEPNAPKTSIFDPVLCEIAYKWFCPKGGLVLDPFCGGSVRGIVAGALGYRYYGIDLRNEQIVANIENEKEVLGENKAHYECGDSTDVLDLMRGKIQADMAFTCPPYFDLEVYSDNEKDISNMDFEHFKLAYETILTLASEELKDDAFFIIVIGDVRDEEGNYIGLPRLTQSIMERSGLKLYDDIVYLTPLGSASMRANGQFTASRKVVNTHQYFQVYLKGDIKKAMKKINA